jgi:predicted Ser/Thr protein kinase
MDLAELSEGVRKALDKIKKNVSAPSVPNEGEMIKFFDSFLRSIITRLQLETHKTNYDVFISKQLPDSKAINACLNIGKNNLKAVGSGAFGTVYKVPAKLMGRTGKKMYAVKVERIDTPFWSRSSDVNPAIQLSESTKLAVRAGKNGIGPKIHKHFACVHGNAPYYITVMDFLDGKPFYDWKTGAKSEELTKVREIVKTKIERLTKMGILHNDLWNQNNIMVMQKNKKVEDVFLVDFGLAATFRKEADRQKNDVLQMMKKTSNGITTTVMRHLFADGYIRGL